MDKTFVTYGFTHQELLALGRIGAYVTNMGPSKGFERLHRFISLAKDGFGITVSPPIAMAILKKMKLCTHRR